MTTFVICVGSSLLSKTMDVTLGRQADQKYLATPGFYLHWIDTPLRLQVNSTSWKLYSSATLRNYLDKAKTQRTLIQ